MNDFFKLGVYEKIDEDHIAPSLNIRKLSANDVEIIKSENGNIFKYSDLFYTWMVFHDNYNDYKREISPEENTKLNDHYSYLLSSEQFFKSSSIAKHVANMLSSFFPFLETSARALRSKYKKESKEMKEWDNLRRDLYSENPEYQLCYELRNYLQHYSLPLAGTNVEIDGGDLKSTRPYADKEHLLSCGYDWKNKKDIFENFDDKINLDSVLDKFYLCLKTLFHKTIELIYEDIKKFELHLQSVYLKYDFRTDEDVIIFKFEEEFQNFNDADMEFIPMYKLRFFKRIIEGSGYKIQ